MCCPICDRPCETIYIDKFGDVVGCDECIESREAWDWGEDARENARILAEESR